MAHAQARAFGEKIDWLKAIRSAVDPLELPEGEKEALRAELARLLGTGGSYKAHWMPSPFFKLPKHTWWQERLLALKRQTGLVAHLLRKKKRAQAKSNSEQLTLPGFD